MSNPENLTSGLDDKMSMAAFLGCTIRTVENYMRKGRIPFIKIGKTVRFERGDVLRHLNENCRVVRSSTK